MVGGCDPFEAFGEASTKTSQHHPQWASGCGIWYHHILVTLLNLYFVYHGHHFQVPELCHLLSAVTDEGYACSYPAGVV